MRDYIHVYDLAAIHVAAVRAEAGIAFCVRDGPRRPGAPPVLVADTARQRAVVRSALAGREPAHARLWPVSELGGRMLDEAVLGEAWRRAREARSWDFTTASPASSASPRRGPTATASTRSCASPSGTGTGAPLGSTKSGGFKRRWQPRAA